VRRHFQKAVAPVAFPPAMRARLDAVDWSRNIAEKFRREEIFHAYRPKLAEALATDHLAIAGTADRWYSQDGRACHSYADAYLHTRRQHAELSRARLSRAFDEQEIHDHAENYARICGKITTHEQLRDFCESIGAIYPVGRGITAEGAAARTRDPKWWRRKLRATWTRRAENVMREIGIVRKGREAYASDDAVRARAGMKLRAKRFLETHEAVNEQGEQLPLFKLAEHSLANPALRRGEFMCRVRGFEEIAEGAGHVAHFWTLTTPSRFHAQLVAGVKNPKFARAVVREAQAWLCQTWAKVRAKLKRLSILLYGFRIAEPHHDATPHWHLLMFCRPRDAETIERVVSGYWVSKDKPGKHTDASELGPHDAKTGRRANQDARCKLIVIDREKGSAVGYVAKYVSKNIDGAGAIGEAGDEETGRPMVDSLRRVDAWASLHGIRQFQQIGGPPVGLWRELRRITEVSEDTDIERARCRADAGDWAGFIRALAFEGIRAGRRVGLRLEREETGELTKYSEEKAPPVVGVRCASVVEITRPHSWRIQRCGTFDASGLGAPDSLAATTDSSDSLLSRSPAPDFSGAARSISCGGLAGLGLNPLLWNLHEGPKRKGLERSTATGGRRSCAQVSQPGALGSSSSIFSDLGPVAITVRGHIRAPAREHGSTPARLKFWDEHCAAWHRAHGRYPSLEEMKAVEQLRDG
jgi:hypothetical protein